MGFATSFISLIKACITGPWISPLLNGRPGPSFQPSRGLRQGCPLSPYLFILMAESFSRALDYNRHMGLITGIKFGNGVKNINHSQFADDTLLMGGASNIIARHFKTLLDKYMSYSGGLINYLKSCIYGWNTSAHVLHRIARTLGVPCKLNWEQFTYLGMPLVWRLITGRNAWWKTVLEKKYLSHPRHQLLDHELPNRACSKIWRMCKKAIPFLDQNTSKVPKGDNYIRIGEDKIMGQQPISQRPLTKQILALFSSAAPSKRYLADEFRWDLSGTIYTIKAAYHQICINEYPMAIWAHWRLVWKAKTLPKIKFVLWILLGGKVLTVENLRKRGIIGPSHCPNCQNEEETIQHLFIDCSFASACWKEVGVTIPLGAWH
eukprot:PITA_03964